MGGIRDKVAIIGMGCSKFGERWNASPEDLIIEASHEAFEDAGIEAKDVQAAWLGTYVTAFTGQIPLQAREGYSVSAGGLVPLFVGSAATLLNLELSAAINVHGFVSYTVIDD